MHHTHSITFLTPLKIGKRYIGDVQCSAVLNYNSKLEYKSGDISELQLGANLSLKDFADWNYMQGSIDELLMPIIDSYADEGAEAIQTYLDELERYNEAVRETENSLQHF